MNYTNRFLKMVEKLRETNEVEFVDAGARVNGFYFEVSSAINIYSNGLLITSYKTPSNALRFLKGGK